MKRTLLVFLLLSATYSTVQAQKKSELFAQIEALKSELDSVNGLVTTARKNEKVSTARAESFEVQVVELQDANATLLKNLTSFAEVSNKNSENINSVLASLEEKEGQLKGINDAIASNDSTAIVSLTNAKQTLGENAKIGVSNGALVISESLDMLFGGSTNTAVTPTSESWIGKVAQLLKVNPSMALTLEGLSMTGELPLATQQAAAIAAILQTKFEIDPSRIMVQGKDGNFKEGINFKIHPKYDEFYAMVKGNVKN